VSDRYKIDELRLSSGNTALVVVDVQQRLVKAMDADSYPLFLSSVKSLIGTANLFDIPVFYSEQYPQGLGTTIEEVLSLLEEGKAERVEKESFSCCAINKFVTALKKSGRTHIVLVGLECHVCLLQTAIDLVDTGYSVHIPEDAAISRFVDNKEVGLRLAERAGAYMTCTETVLFQLLECSTSPQFKEVSSLVKRRDVARRDPGKDDK
jgi:nicotinamidase-related amidase